MQLKNKIAVLSGASSGLGCATAKMLVAKGAQVYGLARNEDKLAQLATELGTAFRPVPIDITHETELRKWAQKSFSQKHCPDILINNAGMGFTKKLSDTTGEDWRQTIDTNLNGTFYLTAAIVPFMKSNDASSHIINIGSIMGLIGQAEWTAYCSSKFGLQGFSEALFKELRSFNIKVSCVNPGSIETDFFRKSGMEAHHNMLQPKDVADTLAYLLETPDNMLINELTVRPLIAKKP